MNKYRTNQTIRTYSRLGKRYLNGIEKIAPRERSEFIRQFRRGAKILEIGCAGGRDAVAFDQAGFIVTGIDPVAVFIREAKKRVPEGLFIRTDVQHLPFQPKSFNGIWASAVLLHVRKQGVLKVLQGLYRLLVPGGLIFIGVKEGAGQKVVREHLTNNLPRVFTYYSKPELEQYVRGAGFVITKSLLYSDGLNRAGTQWIGVWGKRREET